MRVQMILMVAITVTALAGVPAEAQQTRWNVLADLPDQGGGAYLGVRLEEETDYEEGGARVTSVVDDSPADRAGLREGDIIVGFDGQTIRGPVSLTRKIHAHEPGDKVMVRYVRDGDEDQLELELGERSDVWSRLIVPEIEVPDVEIPELFLPRGDSQVYSLGCEEGDCAFFSLDPDNRRPKLGVQLVETTPELRRHLGGDEERGVLVSKVLSGSPAERGGMQVGDLIVAVEGQPVQNTRDLRQALQDTEGKTVAVEVARDGKPRTIEVQIPRPDTDRPTGPRA